MKHRNNAGFSLVEVLVAIVLLGTLVVPICSSLILAFRMNEKTDTMMRAQLAVSSAVETIQAEGIDETAIQKKLKDNFDAYEGLGNEIAFPYEGASGKFPDVSVRVYLTPKDFFGDNPSFHSRYDCYRVEVKSNQDEDVIVTAYIREKEAGA